MQKWLNKLARPSASAAPRARTPRGRQAPAALLRDRRVLPGLPGPPHGAGRAQHPAGGAQPRQGLRRTGLQERRGHWPRCPARRSAAARARPGASRRPAGSWPRRATDDDPLYAAYVLILVNGLRKGEVLGLTWPSIDLDSGENSTSAGSCSGSAGELIHKKRVKTEDSDADDTVPMPDICSAALKLRRDEQDAARQRAGDRWQHSDLVFTTKWGTPIEPRNFNRSFDARCTRAGVPRIRVHDTRHTCASILAALDVHPRVAMRILRHAQIAMTMEVYTEVPDEITRAALKKLGDSLGGPAARPRPRTPHQDQP